jgi:hypothetical protein
MHRWRIRLLRTLTTGTADRGRAFGGCFDSEEDELTRASPDYHAPLEPELQQDGKLTYREVMTEAMRRLGAPEGEEGGLPPPSREPFWRSGRAEEARSAAGGSRSCRTRSRLIASSIQQIGCRSTT